MSYQNQPSEDRPQYRQQTDESQSGGQFQQSGGQQGRSRFEETVTFPVRQTMAFWQNVGEMSMMGFDAAERFQRRGMELTRSALEDYLRSFEAVSAEAQQAVPQQMHVEAQTERQPPERQQSEARGQQTEARGQQTEVRGQQGQQPGQQRQYVGGGRETSEAGVQVEYGQQTASQQAQYGEGQPPSRTGGPSQQPPRRQQPMQGQMGQQPEQGQMGQQPEQSQMRQQPEQSQMRQQPEQGQTGQRPGQGQMGQPPERTQRGQQKRYGESRREVGPPTPQG